MFDGELYYKCLRKRDNQKHHLAKVVHTPEQAIEFHASPIGAHCRVDKTLHTILQRYYWPGMKADIMKWISECHDKQRRPFIKEKTQYTPIVVSEPFELVGMDLVGKLSTKPHITTVYMCVMVDYFTKWLEVYPLKTKKAEEVAECVMDLFYKYGAPKRILTDRGKEFVNKVNLDLCDKLAIARSLCAPCHPQTNGLMERLNGTVQGVLNKMVMGHPSDWDKFIKPTVFGLRTKIQLTTRYSPYYLLYGREARCPSEVPIKCQISDQRVDALMCNEDINPHLRNLEDVYPKVEGNVAAGQERVRKRKSIRGDDDLFMVGDKVLRKNICQVQRKGGKLECEFLGPFTILKIDGKSVDLEGVKGKVIAKINIDHLKRYLEPQPKIPRKWKSLEDDMTTASAFSPAP